MNTLNKKPFSHYCRFGTLFTCSTCDFSTQITVEDRANFDAEFSSDVAEMIGYHAVNILPELNGFQGYDCLDFKFIS